MRYLISLDIGTQGTKAALFDQDMNMAATSFEASRLISPEPGVVWQEPLEIFGSVVHTLKALMEQTGIRPGDVAGIGLDGQMAGVMGIDESGEACTPYDSWLDTRCAKHMDLMNKKAGRRIIELSGGPATFVHGPKILWLQNQHPGMYEKVAKFVVPHAYVVGKLCGLGAEKAYVDHTELHFSCLSDIKNRQWSRELLERFAIAPEKMPTILSPFDVVGGVTEEFAALTGLQSGTPVVAGCGDTAASTFGSGLFEKGMLLDCAGTASVLAAVTDRFAPDVSHGTLINMRSPAEDLFVPLAYINGGGLCIRWLRDALTGGPAMTYDRLQEGAMEIPPGSEGLVFIPHFSGRVLPCEPGLKGAFLGLDFKHTVFHMYRAVMEAIACEYHHYLSVLKALYPGESFRRMMSVGGGAKSDLFNQIKADVLGVAVETFAMGETALIGSAVIAGVGTGLLADYAAPVHRARRRGKVFQPDPAAHALYGPLAARYLSALEHVKQYHLECSAHLTMPDSSAEGGI